MSVEEIAKALEEFTKQDGEASIIYVEDGIVIKMNDIMDLIDELSSNDEFLLTDDAQIKNICRLCGIELPEESGPICENCEREEYKKNLIEKWKDNISFSYGDNPTIHIKDSYLIDNDADIIIILEYIHELAEYQVLKEHGYKRTFEGEMIEWMGHNSLYKLRINRERTGSVDIDKNEHWFRKLLYLILCAFIR